MLQWKITSSQGGIDMNATADEATDRPAVGTMIADSIICDHTLPYAGAPADEIEGHATAGFTYVSITIAADFKPSFSNAVRRLANERAFYARTPGFRIGDTAGSIREAKKSGELAVGFHFQGTEQLERNLDNVWLFKSLGINWMLLAYNWQNNAAVGCLEARERDVGLSVFGRRLVAEMNQAGMIVDLSHTGERCTYEALELSAKPCMYSHSNMLALHDHPRNITDAQVKAVAQAGGIVGITGVGQFVGEASFASVDPKTVFRHIDHVVQLVGPDHVGLGLDYMSEQTCAEAIRSLGGDLKAVGMSPPPWPFLHPRQLPDLVAAMLDAGYDSPAIKAVLGENFLRLLEQCRGGE